MTVAMCDLEKNYNLAKNVGIRCYLIHFKEIQTLRKHLNTAASSAEFMRRSKQAQQIHEKRLDMAQQNLDTANELNQSLQDQLVDARMVGFPTKE